MKFYNISVNVVQKEITGINIQVNRTAADKRLNEVSNVGGKVGLISEINLYLSPT